VKRFTSLRLRAVTGTVLAAVTLTLSACGSSGASSHTGSAPAPAGFHENITTWTLPLDSYIPNPNDQIYAQNLLYSQCMTQHGYPVTAYNIADYLPPDLNAVGLKLFNLNLAEKYGYHSGPPKKGIQAPKPDISGTAEVAQDTQCARSSQQQTDQNQDLTQFVQGLAGEAQDTAQADPKVKAAIARWRTCMLPLGVSDLPASPEDMPTARQRQQFGMNGSANPGPGELPTVRTQATPAEIKQAVADAKCRDSSGYAEAYYQAEVTAQLDLIGKNDNRLSQALDAEKRASAAIAKVLQQHGR
jgi:hypothetical protein